MTRRPGATLCAASVAFATLTGCGPGQEGASAGMGVSASAPPAATEELSSCSRNQADPPDELETRVNALSQQDLEPSYSTSGLTSVDVSLVGLALEVDAERVRPTLDANFALTRGVLGRVVLLALGADSGPGEPFDRALLDRGLSRYYACSRGLPESLSQLRERGFDYRSIEPLKIETSIAKGGPRELFEDAERGIFVAQNQTEDGLETEVILRDQRSDGALDFLAFDARGRRVDQLAFSGSGATGALPVPSACVTCHRDINTARVDVVDPRSGSR